MIAFRDHNEIDRQRWDECIEHSANKLPYALWWWLDAVCPGWNALVYEDYRAVMPLTHGQKYGVDYLYQPFFTQQLGVFSDPEPSSELMKGFVSAIPENYRYVRIQFNSGNKLNHGDFTLTSRKNFLLDLTPSALQITAGYHRNCRRNIMKALQAGLSVKSGPGPAQFAGFIKQHLDKKLTHTGKNFYPSLFRITQASIQNGTGEIAGIYSHTGELLAAGWLVTALGRCLFEVCASTPKGRENQAMYLLVDHMIRKNAGAGLIFDFAGSNSPGIAYFNAGFGAKATYYPAMLRNGLPWPLRLIKR
jgi:hypothetical protein